MNQCFLIDDDNQLILQPLTVGAEKHENDYVNASYIDVSENCNPLWHFAVLRLSVFFFC